MLRDRVDDVPHGRKVLKEQTDGTEARKRPALREQQSEVRSARSRGRLLKELDDAARGQLLLRIIEAIPRNPAEPEHLVSIKSDIRRHFGITGQSHSTYKWRHGSSSVANHMRERGVAIGIDTEARVSGSAGGGWRKQLIICRRMKSARIRMD